jgi:hypothetical protein
MGGTVTDAGDNEAERTPLVGGSKAEKSEEEYFFNYSATLRIFGNINDFDEITKHLGVTPSKTHRQGEPHWVRTFPPYEHDMWSYKAPVERIEPLHAHIDALWNKFKERKEYLLQLKQGLEVDVFLGYRSNSDTAGFQVPYQSLEMFTELQIPFTVSVVIS